MYQSIRGCVDELLDFLKLYQEVIEQGLVDVNYASYANKLMEDIKVLEQSSKNDEALLQYDFKKLKREISAVFHPDRFTSQLDNIEDFGVFFGKTMGIMQDIETLAKGGSSYSFKYNSTTDNSHRRENDSYDEQKEDEEEDFTIGQFLKDRFNAIFRGIPANEKDYSRIIERMEKTISNFRVRLQAIEKREKLLKKRKRVNRMRKEEAVSDTAIEEWYYQTLANLQYEYQKDLISQEKATKDCNTRYEQLLPQIHSRLDYWRIDADNYTARFRSLVRDYQYRMVNFIPTDFEKMNEKIVKMYDYIKANYSDQRKAFNGIEKSVLESDARFQSLCSTLRKANLTVEKSEKMFSDFKNRKVEYQESQRKSINRDFDTEYERIDGNLRIAEIQRVRIDKKRKKMEEKKERFIQEYGPLYEKQNFRHK